ncbi:MAG: CBS domain-containing protein [Deltaproteobacteria bacterium]|nr:CBS domain-containing protein [Deltaproteobacteria bacterium]
MKPDRTVVHIMNRKLLYLRDGDRLSLARSKIQEFGVTAVPVLDDDHRPVGVVSLRDLAHEPIEASSPVMTITDTTPVLEGAQTLARLGAHHLVVVDAKGIAVGMVSALDFVRELAGLEPHHPSAFDRY